MGSIKQTHWEKIERRMYNAIKWRQRIFKTDRHDPAYNEPLSNLYKDYSIQTEPKGELILNA